MVLNRAHEKQRGLDLHAHLCLERQPALLPRRRHRQEDRRANPGPLGHSVSPRDGRRHPRDLLVNNDVQRMDAGGQRVDEPVDHDNDAAKSIGTPPDRKSVV